MNVTREWLDSVGLDKNIELGNGFSFWFMEGMRPELDFGEDSHYRIDRSLSLKGVKTQQDVIDFCRLVGVTLPHKKD